MQDHVAAVLLRNRGHLAAVQVQAGPLPGFEQILDEGARVMQELQTA